jgi:hypothetical protein
MQVRGSVKRTNLHQDWRLSIAAPPGRRAGLQTVGEDAAGDDQPYLTHAGIEQPLMEQT